MSTTTTPAPAAPPTRTQQLTDAAVKTAQDLPALVSTLETINPDLAQQITGKTLLASKTVWGHVILLLLGAALAKLGINWDDQFQVEVAGGIFVAMQAGWGVLARMITKAPIAGVMGKPAVAPPP